MDNGPPAEAVRSPPGMSLVDNNFRATRRAAALPASGRAASADRAPFPAGNLALRPVDRARQVRRTGRVHLVRRVLPGDRATQADQVRRADRMHQVDRVRRADRALPVRPGDRADRADRAWRVGNDLPVVPATGLSAPDVR
ncbi:hypothetical protein BOX37_30800 [Nocardia mangyaensis]|uniref:Uncharacterized protein n=1 Tax=Nocardia mangyaensis TaxID=2213200 RepID=A0A1J0W084_9NOCA|nr:hypothetical protein BOX37_30800 [Nocardia mangyaensis]